MRCPWMDAPGWPLTPGSAQKLRVRAGCSKPAVGGDDRLERKEMLKMVSGTAKKIEICLATKNGDAPEPDIFVTCENDMLRSGNVWLKWGSLARHIYPICIY